ncbi:MAG: hypothetical protein ACRELB_09355 [Polyangiaceae bacterium]
MKEVRAAWPARGWSWDNRLTCVSSSFATELEGNARTAAGLALGSEWTSSTIHRASPQVRALAERTGGLRSGQMILVSAGVGAAFAYGLWWPWGDGMTTSLRIGLEGVDSSQDAFQRLRDSFGVEL